MKILAVVFICLTFSFSALAQQTKKIDHLTVEEDDLIHETQELDKRMEIFVKAIDRRILVLNGTTEVKPEGKEKKEQKKESEKWGALPAGNRAELLADIKSILNEAVTKIDDAAEHNAKSPLLPKALKTLGAGCSRFITQLKPFYENAKSDAERASAYDSIETCKEVIDSQSKLTTNTAKQ